MRALVPAAALASLAACGDPAPQPRASAPDEVILRVIDHKAQTQPAALANAHLLKADLICRNRGFARTRVDRVSTIDDYYRDVIYRCI